jgi:hypothetical protein
MPLRHIDGADLDYYLVLFDSDGNQRPELDGSLLGKKLAGLVQDGITDVFFSSHGWMGDVPAAIKQYNSWISVMAGQAGDLDRARVLAPGFKALIVGVQWPSLPWGNENAAAALLGDDEADDFATEQQMDSELLVRQYAERIADTDAARTALTTILAATDDDDVKAQLADGKLPARLERAYQTLFDEAGLGVGGAAAAPGSDQQTFTPTLTISEWTSAAEGLAQPEPSGQPGLLGGGFAHNVKDALLAPVRQLSFWAMKHRARHVGETGVHSLLTELQESAPDARFHLMGHSFGCIVVSAAISGPMAQGAVTSRLPRPVHSLFLAQGALSLWSFAENIPFLPNVPGYFRPIDLPPPLVSGPIITTRSKFDHAVGIFFPLGARLGNELLLGEDLPEFGGVGAFGLQGTAAGTTHDVPVLHANAEYGFDAGHIYNIDASTVICHGGWPSGAHSDIAHPQIAHLFWQAALAGIAHS